MKKDNDIVFKLTMAAFVITGLVIAYLASTS